MAFPFETTHLIAHLRASYLALTDNDQYAERIIKPLQLSNSNLNDETSALYLQDRKVASSPPIAFNIARLVQKSYDDQNLTPYNQIQHQSHSHHQQHQQPQAYSKKSNPSASRKRKSTRRLRSKSIKEEDPIDSLHPPEPDLKPEFEDEDPESEPHHFEINLTSPTSEDLPKAVLLDDSGTTHKLNKFGLNYTKTIRGKGRKQNAISKLFHSQPKSKQENDDITDSDSDSVSDIGNESDNDSDGSVKTQKDPISSLSNLELIEEETYPDDKITERSNDRAPNMKSYAVTIDSDYGAPISTRGESSKDISGFSDRSSTIKNDHGDSEQGEVGNDYDEEKYDLYDEYDDDDEDGAFTDEEDDDEEDDEDDDFSSTDSAFTDIETDSILDSSLLDSFNDVGESYSFGNPNNNIEACRNDSKKLKKKKHKPNTYDSQSYSKTEVSGKSFTPQNMLSSTYNNGGNTNNTIKTNTSSDFNKNNQITAPTATNKSSMLGHKKNSITFEKREINSDAKELPGSHLSLLIQSRSKSANLNPLQFYSFANSNIDGINIHKVKINIFVPPLTTPSISDLKVDDNVSIADCIGYFLLSLSKLDDFKYISADTYSMNPNHWRLELVDEDGENYGSFGILDRTRLLSSYNNPRDIAICKVENTSEIVKNNNLSPLPKEFKNTIASFEERQNKLNSIIEDDTSPVKKSPSEKEETIELKIMGTPFGTSNCDTVNYFVSVNSTIEDLLNAFCSEHGLDAGKYKLREKVVGEDNKLRDPRQAGPPQTLLHGTLTDSLLSGDLIYKKPVNANTLVSNLKSDVLELIPSGNAQSKFTSQASNSKESFLESGITPSDSTFAAPGITPPAKKHLEDKFLALNLDSTKQASSRQASGSSATKDNASENVRRQLNSNKYLEEIISGKNSQIPTSLNEIYLKWKVFRKKPTILNKIEKSLIIDGDYIHLTPTEDTTWKKNPLENPFSSSNQGHGSTGHGHHHHYLHHYNYSNYYNKLMMKTSSFHITQITKLKQYKNSKNPNHFKIVIKKEIENEANTKENAIKKKYDLEAVNVAECEDIINKIKYVLQVYNMTNMNVTY